MARALVLGATGHIGAHVVRALLAGGHDVRAAYRTERYLSVLDGLPVERVRVDLDSLEGLDAALGGCPWVIHAGAYYPRGASNTARAVEHALTVTRSLIERLRAAQPERVVLTSSAATIRHVPGRPATEQDAESWPPLAPRSTYSTVKIAIEHEFLASGLPLVVVNPSVCIGEYDARAFSGQLILAFAKLRLPFYIDHTLNAVYTGDVGIGHVRAAEVGRVGERYLLSCATLTVQQVAAMIAAATGSRAPRWKIPHAALRAAAPLLRIPRHAVQSVRQGQFLDGSKAVRELGMPQTPVEEAVRRAVAWFKAHGYA
jgi:dihydroflavonol-4-reductase